MFDDAGMLYIDFASFRFYSSFHFAPRIVFRVRSVAFEICRGGGKRKVCAKKVTRKLDQNYSAVECPVKIANAALKSSTD